MVDIVFDPEFHGPSLLELEPIIDTLPQEPIKVKWQNTREEFALLERQQNRKFVLCVADRILTERLTVQLGRPIQLDYALFKSGMDALVDKKLYDWRHFTAEKGTPLSRNIMVKAAADAIRKGQHPKLALVVKDCLQEGISPVDADVLLRLKVLRGF